MMEKSAKDSVTLAWVCELHFFINFSYYSGSRLL